MGINPDFFEGLPHETSRIVEYELNNFLSRSWDLDEEERKDIKGGLISKIYEERDRINAAETPGAYIREICRNYFCDVLRERRCDNQKDLTPKEKRKKYEKELENFWQLNPINPDPPKDFDLNKETSYSARTVNIEDLSLEELEKYYKEKFSPEFQRAVDTSLILVSAIIKLREMLGKKINIELITSLNLLRALQKFKKEMRSILGNLSAERVNLGKEWQEFGQFYRWARKICDKAENEKLSDKEQLVFYGQLKQLELNGKPIFGISSEDFADRPEGCPLYLGSREEFNLVIPELNFLAKLNELIRLCKSWVLLKQDIFYNYPWFEPYYFSLLGIEDLSSDYFSFLQKLKIRPCQILFDVLRRAPDLRRGGAYSSLKKIKFIMWYLKLRHQNTPYSFILEPIKKTNDIEEKLRQYHYRHKSKFYERLVNNIYKTAFILQIGLPLYDESEELKKEITEMAKQVGADLSRGDQISINRDGSLSRLRRDNNGVYHED